MRRRDFMALVGGAAAWPLAARAQPNGPVRRLGALFSVEQDARGQARYEAFSNALARLGWIEGRNLSTIIRWGVGNESILRERAEELVALHPDVIFAAPITSVPPVQSATKTIPIVFAQTADPVGLGIVQSLAKPGGNTTGFATFDRTIAAKWVELLKQIAPSIARIAVVSDPRQPTAAGYLTTIQAAASSLSVDVLPYQAVSADGIESAFEAIGQQANVGLIMPPSGTAVSQRDLVVSLAAKYRVPGVYAYRYYPALGGLASYGVDDVEGYAQAASYVDRIFKGEKPADLPVQYATKFQLVINLKTAKALGLTISPSFLLTADEVIE
jgi:putative tryptophan/tyrosine transport system substrate-binding protein